MSDWDEVECLSEEARLIREEWFGMASEDIPEASRHENLACGWKGWRTLPPTGQPRIEVECVACQRVFVLTQPRKPDSSTAATR